MVLNPKKIQQLAHNLASPATVEQEIAELKGRSLWQLARARFARNRAAMISLITLLLIVVFSIFGNSLSPWDHEQIDWDAMGDVQALGAPSIQSRHYFGTDDLGRDLYARVIQGSQISLMVGLIGSLIAVVVGTLYGATAGYLGGRIDALMMRSVDILLAIPFMFVLILLMVMFGRSIYMIFIGIGLLSWLDMSRIIRGQTLSLKNREFIEAARAIGVRPLTIITRHIIPNVLGIVVVYATLLVPGMIMTESFISFLGLGVQEPQTSWGALINEGARTIQNGTLWQLLFPLAFFIVTLLSFYFIGDGLRDALDPKDE